MILPISASQVARITGRYLMVSRFWSKMLLWMFFVCLGATDTGASLGL
jgi:hypothetical protein